MQLAREEEVGELGPTVGELRVVPLRGVALEHGALTAVVRDRGHGRDPRRRRRQQVRHEQPGEREVPEVVRAELQLEAVLRRAVRRGHQPGVVDQHVDRVGPRSGERAHGREVGEVERGERDVGVRRRGAQVTRP